MAGLWQKALFYLGLVDEDEPGHEGGAVGVGTAAAPAPEAHYPNAVAAHPGRRSEAPAPEGIRASRRVEPPLAGRRRSLAEGALSEAGVIVTPSAPPLVRTVTEADLQTEVIAARSYADAQLLADHIRANLPVVLDLRKVEPAMVRRLVDFASGLTYALGGSMRKIGQGVILVTPANVHVGRDERRRLESLGFYQVTEGG